MAALSGQGYVLHSRPWKESSLLLELLTPDHGRIGAIMRSGRRVGGRYGTRPQPFHCYGWQLAGRGELKTVTDLEMIGPPRRLSARSLVTGLYFNELLVRALGREEAVPALYAAYDSALRALAGCESAELFAVARRFELALLEEMGVAPSWVETMEGAPVMADMGYWLDPEAGVSRRPGAGRPVQGTTLLALEAGQFPSGQGSWREAQTILAWLLAPHIGPAPLRSRELWPGRG